MPGKLSITKPRSNTTFLTDNLGLFREVVLVNSHWSVACHTLRRLNSPLLYIESENKSETITDRTSHVPACESAASFDCAMTTAKQYPYPCF